MATPRNKRRATRMDAHEQKPKVSRSEPLDIVAETVGRLKVAQETRDHTAAMELAQQVGALWNAMQHEQLARVAPSVIQSSLVQPAIEVAVADRDRAKGRRLGRAWNEERKRQAAQRAQWFVVRGKALRARHKT